MIEKEFFEKLPRCPHCGKKLYLKRKEEDCFLIGSLYCKSCRDTQAEVIKYSPQSILENIYDELLREFKKDVENTWYVVYGTLKGTEESKVIQSFRQRWKAEKMCEEWGWNYDDGQRSYWMSYEEENQYKEEEI